MTLDALSTLATHSTLSRIAELATDTPTPAECAEELMAMRPRFQYGGRAPKLGLDCLGVVFWYFERRGYPPLPDPVSICREDVLASHLCDFFERVQPPYQLDDVVVFPVTAETCGIPDANRECAHTPDSGSHLGIIIRDGSAPGVLHITERIGLIITPLEHVRPTDVYRFRAPLTDGPEC